MIEPGLIASWFPSSSQVFSPSITFLDGTWVLTISNPLIVPVYRGFSPSRISATSLIVYSIASPTLPSLYLGRSVNLPSHKLGFSLFASAVDNVMLSYLVPSAYNSTVMLVRLPSWLLLSTHCFVTGISIFSGVCLFVIVNPFGSPT